MVLSFTAVEGHSTHIDEKRHESSLLESSLAAEGGPRSSTFLF